MDSRRRKRDVRRFRRVHIVRGIRLTGKPDVCASLVTYRTVLGALSLLFLFILPRSIEQVIEANTIYDIKCDTVLRLRRIWHQNNF